MLKPFRKPAALLAVLLFAIAGHFIHPDSSRLSAQSGGGDGDWWHHRPHAEITIYAEGPPFPGAPDPTVTVLDEHTGEEHHHLINWGHKHTFEKLKRGHKYTFKTPSLFHDLYVYLPDFDPEHVYLEHKAFVELEFHKHHRKASITFIEHNPPNCNIPPSNPFVGVIFGDAHHTTQTKVAPWNASTVFHDLPLGIEYNFTGTNVTCDGVTFAPLFVPPNVLLETDTTVDVFYDVLDLDLITIILENGSDDPFAPGICFNISDIITGDKIRVEGVLPGQDRHVTVRKGSQVDITLTDQQDEVGIICAAGMPTHDNEVVVGIAERDGELVSCTVKS